MTLNFTDWTKKDLWKQYQYCQENASNFHKQMLKEVITEIKKSVCLTISVTEDPIKVQNICIDKTTQ